MKQLKTLSALIAMLLCSTCLFAYDFEVNGIYYNILSSTDRTVEVTYKGDSYSSYSNEYSGNISISKNVTYNGSTYRVTSIGRCAFEFCSGLTSIEIPNSVTSIGGEAFYNCSGLTSVTIPNSVTSIGDFAFTHCFGLTSVTILNSVTSIGRYAFEFCSGLTSVHISDLEAWCKIKFAYGSSNPLYYAGHLYLNGEEIKDLVIPNSVTSIGDYAFEGCSGLTSVTIPNSVTRIGDRAFYNCSGLTSVHISDLEAWCSKINFVNGASNPLCYAGHLYLNGEEIKDLVIPNSVTSIGGEVFYNCSGLTSVTIPNSVTSIGNYAFYNCSGLTSVTIPNSVTSIGSSAFSGCSGLTSVTIPNSVTSIGNYAFEDCSGLTSVHISDLEAWCKIKFGSSDSNPLYNAGHLYLNGEEIKDLVIPNSVTSIGSYAFYDCSGLTSVTIPNSVESIGDWAFEYCSSLKLVINLSNLNIISGSSDNGYVAYYADRVVTGDFIDGDYVWAETDGEYTLVSYLGNETNLVLPDGYNGKNYAIGEYAFLGCSGLRALTIGSGVKSIGDCAFEDCEKLEDVYAMSLTAVECNKNIFSQTVYDNGTLYVPEGSIASYEKTLPWYYFYIRPIPTAIEGVEMDAEDADAPVYNLRGVRMQSTDNLPKGVYIRNGKKFVVK